MRKRRPIPEFARLTPEQKTQLYSWFRSGHTYDQLCAMVAQPEPEGFGLKVSKDKMVRYYHRWQEIQELQKEDNTRNSPNTVWNGAARVSKRPEIRSNKLTPNEPDLAREVSPSKKSRAGEGQPPPPRIKN